VSVGTIVTPERIREHLTVLYGDARGAACFERLHAMLDDFHARNPQLATPVDPSERLTERDALLITYGDQVSEAGKNPLDSLREVLETHLHGVLSGVHILPFYPYTSDDGFSVVDYAVIDSALGGWEDVAAIRRAGFRMMFDFVVNHISASSDWFQGFLRDAEPYRDYFIVVPPGTDVSLVTRPRTHPLLTPFETPQGEKLVWTTFSTDQIDLNFANEEVLLAMCGILLLYIEHGAQLIRLDAIGYLWKELGTRCIHLPQTHRVVQLWRAMLDVVAPNTLLVTETNVPHVDNISYFGDGTNEAQMVYQFPLAPLTLHTFHTGNAQHLTRWAQGLDPMGATATFFNFLASHDGIGVMPAVGILSSDEIAAIVERCLAHGGYVSYKNNSDGSQSPYELNITFFDALSNPQAAEADARAIDRFVAAHAIMLALAGVPGLYVHSLLGSPSNHAGVAETGRYRTVNRRKWTRAELEAHLAEGRGQAVFTRMRGLLQARAAEAAFHPNAAQRVLDLGVGVFAVLRTAADGSKVLCVQSVSAARQSLSIDLQQLGFRNAPLSDLLGGGTVAPSGLGQLDMALAPYQVLWLKGS
jgi:glucosylglycerate phosphorylase